MSEMKVPAEQSKICVQGGTEEHASLIRSEHRQRARPSLFIEDILWSTSTTIVLSFLGAVGLVCVLEGALFAGAFFAMSGFMGAGAWLSFVYRVILDG